MNEPTKAVIEYDDFVEKLRAFSLEPAQRRADDRRARSATWLEWLDKGCVGEEPELCDSDDDSDGDWDLGFHGPALPQDHHLFVGLFGEGRSVASLSDDDQRVFDATRAARRLANGARNGNAIAQTAATRKLLELVEGITEPPAATLVPRADMPSLDPHFFRGWLAGSDLELEFDPLGGLPVRGRPRDDSDAKQTRLEIAGDYNDLYPCVKKWHAAKTRQEREKAAEALDAETVDDLKAAGGEYADFRPSAARLARDALAARIERRGIPRPKDDSMRRLVAQSRAKKIAAGDG